MCTVLCVIALCVCVYSLVCNSPVFVFVCTVCVCVYNLVSPVFVCTVLCVIALCVCVQSCFGEDNLHRSPPGLRSRREGGESEDCEAAV